MTEGTDLDKKLTYGDADGPMRYIATLGMEVPTFIDPREDLIPPWALNRFKRLDYHVPFAMRGRFRVDQWPEEYAAHVGKQVKTDMGGYVLCEGTSKDGSPCSAHAVNRTHRCRNHGASLHPCDKKMSGMNIQPLPDDRVQKLDRVQRFMQGIITPDELDDDEIKGQFVRNDQGIPVSTAKLGAKFQAIFHKELLVRMNNYIRTKAPRAIEVMYEIADNEVYEAADRLKASQWLAERVVGKTPDVLVSLDAKDTPFTSILSNIESGSRSDYRKNIAIERGESVFGDNGNFVDDTSVLDAEVVDDTEESDDEEYEEYEADEYDYEVKPASTSTVVDDIEARKQQIKEARDRIKKAKARRYAARATGATSLDALPFLMKYSPDKETGGWRVKLVLASTASPAAIDRLIG